MNELPPPTPPIWIHGPFVICANHIVSEVAWISESKRDFLDFTGRVSIHGERLNERGVHFFPSPEVDWTPYKKAKEPKTLFACFNP